MQGMDAVLRAGRLHSNVIANLHQLRHSVWQQASLSHHPRFSVSAWQMSDGEVLRLVPKGEKTKRRVTKKQQALPEAMGKRNDKDTKDDKGNQDDKKHNKDAKGSDVEEEHGDARKASVDKNKNEVKRVITVCL